MSTLKFTGLKEDAACTAVADLNDLLANFQVFYANLRGFHWNIQGCSFFTLHAKFEELYDDAADKIDEIAERILALNGTPVNKYSVYLGVSEIKEVSDVNCGEKAVNNILESFGVLIGKERKIKNLADAAGDSATSDLVGDYIAEQEKTVWMLVAYLTKKQ